MACNFVKYSRLKGRKKDYVLQDIEEKVVELYCDYTPTQIKHYWRKDSLSRAMAISGHLSERAWDDYDLDYKAGQIVEFCNHVFNDHDNNKVEVYQIMEDLNIHFDFLMALDYTRAKRREQKYKNKKNGWYKIDSNLESRIWKTIKLNYNEYKKPICILGFICCLISGIIGVSLFVKKRG